MGLYREQVLPRLVERACGGADMQRWRQRVVTGLAGTVVEIGFGSGLNLPVYPPEVTLVYAVEPSDVARKRAGKRIEGFASEVRLVGLAGEAIPLPDDSCDGAVSTFTLCTIADVDGALAELRRVLRPGGRLHFLEHGHAPDPLVSRWQERLEPLQKRLADGCHLTRDPVALVRKAGFVTEEVDQRYARGPKPWSYFTSGVAVNPA